MKLVRDRIPEIIEGDGKWCLCRRVNGVDEHMVWLKEKIVEEAQEFIENPCYEEAADMLEVVRTFCHLSKLEWETLQPYLPCTFEMEDFQQYLLCIFN